MPKVRSAPIPLSPSIRLQLMWLASPALPVGGFSYSEGLEAAVDTGRVQTEAQAAHWLLYQLQLSLARSDMPVVARAVPAWLRGDLARISELNEWVTQTRETSELRLQTEQMGRSLVEWLRNNGQQDERTAACASLKPAPTWPVAFALAVAQCIPKGMPPPPQLVEEALLAYAFGWAENMVQTAIKAVPLGQSAGQRILQALTQAIPSLIESACQVTDSQRQAFTPMLAILSAQHESQYSRLFRS